MIASVMHVEGREAMVSLRIQKHLYNQGGLIQIWRGCVNPSFLTEILVPLET